MRIGKSLDFPLSFYSIEFFLRPAAFYLILKNDAEVSFFEVMFDAFSKRLHMVVLSCRPPRREGERRLFPPEQSLKLRLKSCLVCAVYVYVERSLSIRPSPDSYIGISLINGLRLDDFR